MRHRYRETLYLFKVQIYPGINDAMQATAEVERRRELGDFIRAQRERVAPASVGVIAARRRRTPGLRREEVAELAGLSTTWYTWIEQGRDVSVSPTALARLARALRLGRAQRQYLFELAGKRDPDPGASDIDELPAVLTACVAAIAGPAYLLTAIGMRAPGTWPRNDSLPAGSTGRQRTVTGAICCASSSWSSVRGC